MLRDAGTELIFPTSTLQLDDYGLDSSGAMVTGMIDSWIFVNASDGVKEIHDYFYDSSGQYSGDYAIEAQQFDHGNIVSIGGTTPNVYSEAYGWNSVAGAYVSWPYSIWMQDVKVAVTTPAGTFQNVTSQAEQQGTGASIMRLRWYFAPEIGYIAMTSMDASWQPVNTMYLLETCVADDQSWTCP